MKILNNEYFGNTQGINIKRSKLDGSHSIHTTFRAGKLIPIEWMEILPGQTVSYDLSALVRGSTPKFTVMDDAYLDTYAFFVPNRLLWSNWQKFMGESDDAWLDDSTVYTVPQILISPNDHVEVGNVLDYLGVPCELSFGDANIHTINALPLRAYIKIWNDWFRNQNIQDSVPLYTGDNTITYQKGSTNGVTIYTNTPKGGMLLPVSRNFDLFSSCLPDPQRGPSVKIPFNDFINTGLRANYYSGTSFDTTDFLFNPNESSYTYLDDTSDFSSVQLAGLNFSDYAGTISELRMAFSLQRYYELLARSGSRYVEILQNFFNVTNGDARLQRSEFLCGNKTRLNINQVVQSSSTSGNEVLGKTGAYSLTTFRNSMFTKSFTEHGILMVVACVRYKHSYCQGISKQFRRKTKFDYYWPQFDNLSEQPIFKDALYIGANENQVFGYNEAWAEYRYYPNINTGYMRTNINSSLGLYYTYGDNYSSVPSLSESWMMEDANNIVRTFALSGDEPYSFLADFHVKLTNVLPMSQYSIPGLVDHN